LDYEQTRLFLPSFSLGMALSLFYYSGMSSKDFLYFLYLISFLLFSFALILIMFLLWSLISSTWVHPLIGSQCLSFLANLKWSVTYFSLTHVVLFDFQEYYYLFSSSYLTSGSFSSSLDGFFSCPKLLIVQSQSSVLDLLSVSAHFLSKLI
jgi:hypothetical protein